MIFDDFRPKMSENERKMSVFRPKYHTREMLT